MEIKKSTLWLILFLLMNVHFSQAQIDETYKIQRGDRLTIQVMDHGEFNVNNVVVLPDGYIQYPALGSIKVVGLTPSQLKEIIRKNLLTYVPVPIVTVFIDRLYKTEINVLGHVSKSGKYQIFEPIDILSALSIAGGIKTMKGVKYVRIIRRDGTNFKLKIKQIWQQSNSKKKGKRASRTILLYPGDTLFVPEPKQFNWSIITTIATTLNLIATMIYYFNNK